LTTPPVEELAGPRSGFVIPEVPEIFLNVIHEDGGPLIHNGWEDEQRSFDSTCRKFYRFLTQPPR
jgi:hypothetical protein